MIRHLIIAMLLTGCYDGEAHNEMVIRQFKQCNEAGMGVAVSGFAGTELRCVPKRDGHAIQQ